MDFRALLALELVISDNAPLLKALVRSSPHPDGIAEQGAARRSERTWCYLADTETGLFPLVSYKYSLNVLEFT